MATSTEQQSKLAQTAVNACLAYNTWDIDHIMSFRTATGWFQVHPKSMGRPRMNNDEYRQFFSSIMPLFRDFTVHVTDVIEDAAKHKVAVHCYSTAQTAVGAYENEYVIILKMTDDDEKVCEFIEFVDSAFSNEFFPRLRAALAEKASK